MNLSRAFILRPVATALLMVALALTGILAWRVLPVAALPQVDYPIIQVFTYMPGASPSVTGSAITAPLERRLGQIPGLRQMSSASASGASIITLQFDLGLPMSVAEQEVQAAIQAAGGLLPDGLPAPPIYRKVNPADVPILTLAMSSPTLPLHEVYDLVDTRLAQRLAQVSGVGMVSLAGGQRPALRIEANVAALAAYGLTLEDVRTAIGAATVNQPKGSFDGPVRSILMEANDQLRSAEEYRELVIAWRGDAPVRLSQVATVDRAPEDRRLAAWVGEIPAVLVNIQRQPGANVIEVVERIQALMPQLQATLPAAVDVQVLSDRTQSIRASVRGVQHELVFAVLLVVGVTWLFLRSAAATLIPSIAVPLSLIGTFGFMAAAGFSINNLTLMALTIAAGFVVDDAIVMLENIARHRERGASPLEAALKGAGEIGFTLVSLTFSLVAVLIPLLFMGDVVGRLFREFALTLAVAILISLVVSLTLTPMMCARMLPAGGHAQQGPLDRIIKRYGRWLDWVLDRQGATLLVLLATIAATVGLYLATPKGFFPSQDSGLLQGVTEASPTVSFAAMAARQQALASALVDDEDVRALASFIGVDGVNTTLNSGRLLIQLPDPDERSAPLPEIMARLQARADQIPGVRLYLQPVQELTIEASVSRTQYQFTLTTPDRAELAEWSGRVVAALQVLPALADVASDLQEGGLRALLSVDRDAAARAGVTMAAVDQALYSAFGQRQIATLFTQANQYRVVLEASPERARDPSALEGLYVRGEGGALVPMAAIASVEIGPTALLSNHLGQFPSATVSFNLGEGHSLGDAIESIDATLASLDLPASIDMRYQGAAEAFQRSLSNTLWLVLAAVVTMYLVLGILYESLVHPVTILSTLPSATVGALLALQVSGKPIDLVAVIGIVLLIGLVKKNGIMMVDFALDAERNDGLSPREAIHRAALLRFRPILMTTLAALFGAVPLMLASSYGAELRQPLGWVMVGGLLCSQVLTLFTTPVVYLFFDRWASRWRRRDTTAGDVARSAVDAH